MRALIDCGATGEFIDHEFVLAHELWTYQLPRPIGLYNADGSPNEIGKITEAIDLVVQYKGHKSRFKFYVSSVGHKAIVLGHTWLVEHNPNINWHTGEAINKGISRVLLRVSPCIQMTNVHLSHSPRNCPELYWDSGKAICPPVHATLVLIKHENRAQCHHSVF